MRTPTPAQSSRSPTHIILPDQIGSASGSIEVCPSFNPKTKPCSESTIIPNYYTVEARIHSSAYRHRTLGQSYVGSSFSGLSYPVFVGGSAFNQNTRCSTSFSPFPHLKPHCCSPPCYESYLNSTTLSFAFTVLVQSTLPYLARNLAT